MRFWLALPLLLVASPTYPQAVQLLDPQFFGQPTDHPVRLFQDKVADEGQPYQVSLDVRCGVYYAASVFYSPPVTFQSVKAALDRLYAPYETKYSTQTLRQWRVENWRTGGRKPQYGTPPPEHSLLAISLSSEQENVHVIYIEGHLRLAVCSGSDTERK